MVSDKNISHLFFEYLLPYIEEKDRNLKVMPLCDFALVPKQSIHCNGGTSDHTDLTLLLH